jgi:hypothetical protein
MAMGAPADPAALHACAQAGLTRVLHWVPSAGLNVIEAALERWETAIAAFNGEA